MSTDETPTFDPDTPDLDLSGQDPDGDQTALTDEFKDDVDAPDAEHPAEDQQ